MIKKIITTMICGGVLIIAGCGAEQAAESIEPESAANTIQSIDVTYSSRGVDVPATIVMPAVDADEPVPLVVMAHGHGGSRHEGGGYEQVALAMAERGIATIRMDFPGCGDSTEPFTDNNLTNMLADLQAARSYVATQVNVDPGRAGLLGFSMGGRLVALLSEIDPSYKAMAMWAPAVSDGAAREMQVTFGGAEEYAAKRQQAVNEGTVVYTTVWGTDLELGMQWFSDIETSRPQAALAKFSGPLLVVYGDADQAVTPDVSASAVSAAVNSSEVKEVMIPGARHGLGFYTNRPEVASQVVESTAEFLANNL